MKRIAILITLVLFPLIGQAAAYWLEIKGNGKVNAPVSIQVCYGYIDEFSIRHRDTGPELALTGDFKVDVLDDKGNRVAVPIHQAADCWEGTFTPTTNGVYRVLGINDAHPVVDRSKTGGKNVRPIDYLCTAYQAGSFSGGDLKPAQFLDIITATNGKLVVVKAFNNGGIAGNSTKLRIFNPENWEKELTVDDHGEATFMPTMSGLYIIREDWVDAAPGTYKGISYTGTRHRCNYCLLVQ